MHCITICVVTDCKSPASYSSNSNSMSHSLFYSIVGWLWCSGDLLAPPHSLFNTWWERCWQADCSLILQTTGVKGNDQAVHVCAYKPVTFTFAKSICGHMVTMQTLFIVRRKNTTTSMCSLDRSHESLWPCPHQSQQSDSSSGLLSLRTQGKADKKSALVVTYGRTDGVTMLSSLSHMTHKHNACVCVHSLTFL